MYWVYLVIFIMAVMTPQIVGRDSLYLREADIESLIIFFFGALGFFIYMGKEKAFLRLFKEVGTLQKQTNTISRDLSQSYSYIGEVNRRLEVMRNLITNLPHPGTLSRAEQESQVFQIIMRALSTLAKTEEVALYLIEEKTGRCVHFIDNLPKKTSRCFTGAALLEPGKTAWEQEGCVIARTAHASEGLYAFVVFTKQSNEIEDQDAFQMLASQALFSYLLLRGNGQEAGEETSYADRH